MIEELVGDIQDEFDQEVSSFTRVNESEFVVEGFEARVTSTDGRRVTQVHFRKLPNPERS